MTSIPDPSGNASAAAQELFEWLRGLSFIESRRSGLFPHDLTREALTADLRWRNPDWYAELHRRARTFYNQRLSQSSPDIQQQILLDYVYLHRDNPMVKPFMEWQASGSLLAEAAQPADLPALVEMVELHEGPESASLAGEWLRLQPRGVTVWRDAQGRPAGFLSMIALEKANPEQIRPDPAARAASEYLKRQTPLRPGESAIYIRFWMARDTYQEVSGIQSLAFISMVRYYLTTPGLAFAFLPCAEPDFWAPVMTYGNLSRLAEMDFVTDGRRYGVYGHDWRKTPPMAWLATLAETEITNAPRALPVPRPDEQLIVLSQEEFISAVRAALRDYPRPDLLAGNPLLRSRLVIDESGTTSSDFQAVEKLRALIREAANTMQAIPRDAKLYRAIYHTYLQPAPTQEIAAEILDLPFSTYRRHLKTGITRLTVILWQRELSGGEKPLSRD
jgi:hypothetical protein